MIRVGFSTSKNVVSWAIRKLTRSHVSHCFFIANLWGTECVLQAAELGFVALPLTEFLKGHQIITIYGLALEDTPTMQHALSLLGKPYDFLGLFGFLWVLLGRKLGRAWKNPVHSEGQLFCSEAIVRVLQKANYPGASLLDPERTSPQDLLVFMAAKA